MTRQSNMIEFVKDKVGKLFIKSNSVICEDNKTLDNKIKILETIVTGNTASSSNVKSMIDTSKYVVISAHVLNTDLGLYVMHFEYQGYYHFGVFQNTRIVNEQYGLLGYFNKNVSIKVFYKEK